jgi:hypothetical protein
VPDHLPTRKAIAIHAKGMNDVYTYSMSGRRPSTLFALVVSVSFVLFGWAYAAPWYAIAPPLIVVPMVLYVIIANPIYGLRIDRHAMEIDRNGDAKRILLTSIDYIKITEFSDSSDATIHLKDGKLYQIPQMTRPPKAKFRRVLADYGIAVTKG